jgi:hypothetical protein
VRDHYGTATEGPRRPVTSAPMSSTTLAVASPEKARPQRTTAVTTAAIKWPDPLSSKGNPHVARAKGSKNQTLEGCNY